MLHSADGTSESGVIDGNSLLWLLIIMWLSGTKTTQVFSLICTAITICNASCGVETCEPPQEFGYESCRNFNNCLMDPRRGGCTMRNRNILMLPQCSCYMACESSFKLLYENPEQSYCYYRGLLNQCLISNHICLGITSKYLENFSTDCPCEVENCLTSEGGFPYQSSCYNHLMCLGRGPVASNAAGCSSPQAVREKMIEKGIFISNPNGTWILKKNCHCENSCPGELFHLLPSCSRVQKLIACYQEAQCSIKKFKKKLSPCSCDYLCRSEIAAVKALKNGTKEELCQKKLKYEDCKKKYGCLQGVKNLCSGKSGLHISKWQLLATIAVNMMQYPIKFKRLWFSLKRPSILLFKTVSGYCSIVKNRECPGLQFYPKWRWVGVLNAHYWQYCQPIRMSYSFTREFASFFFFFFSS